MAFCGQCGFLLPPKVSACPRCGVAVIPVGESEGQNAHDATMLSTTQDKTEQARNLYGSKPGVAQEPNQFAGYNSQTQGVGQGEDTPLPKYHPETPIPPPPPEYISRGDREFSTTQGGSYPGSVSPTGPGTRSPSILPRKTKSRGTLLAMLLILFLVGVVAIVFVIGPARVLQVVRGGDRITPQPTTQVSTATPVPSTPTLTPEQQAKSVIDRYYAAINNKDYQTAYNLWVNYPDSYQNFTNGFTDTQRDEHQFGQVLQQSDGTIQVYITLVATSNSYQQTTYQGYYVVGKQPDGSWKIITASMKNA